MERFIIGYGLNGGFGGIQSYEVIETTDLEDASKWAYDNACQEYDSMAGMHGLRDTQEIMDEDECDYEDAEYTYNEEREGWIDYVAFKYSKEKEEELSGYHFDNPYSN